MWISREVLMQFKAKEEGIAELLCLMTTLKGAKHH